MRTVEVVTVGRSDYGIYLPILRRIQDDPELDLHLVVAGMHLSPEFGLTVSMIEADGFEVRDRVEMLLSSDTPEGIATSMGLGLIGFAAVYARRRPDILLVLGDRFEMHAAALAALPFNLPVAHVHGGEVTEGVMDEALRHSMTKLSHLHFTATEEYARRVRQLGEEAWRITVSGAPSLDKLRTMPLLPRAALEAEHRLRLGDPPLLVTFHPVTLAPAESEREFGEVLAALEETARCTVFTLPNADTSGRRLIRMIERFVDTHAWAQKADNLGPQAYFSMMEIAAVMVGNSSSGLIEAPSFELPVVNVGTRQKGRVRGANVIDVAANRTSIRDGIQRALAPAFRAGLRGMSNPYDAGGEAAKIIVDGLKTVPLDRALIVKAFRDLPLSG